MVSASRSLLLTCALVFVCLIGVSAPTAAWPQQCPGRTALAAFSGNANFNNTIRAQMWINDTFFEDFPGTKGGTQFSFASPTWWGAFSDNSTGIYFYKKVGNEFVKGDFIDGNFSAGDTDTLWNGRELFILVYHSGSLARLYKYTYSVEKDLYVPVPGFPVNLPLAGFASGIALHQDSTGKLWATYTSDRNVHVIWSTPADPKKPDDHTNWNTTGLILADDVATFTSEAATIMHFDGNKIGVVWSNQALGEIGFRFHRDGDPEKEWSPKEIVDCCQGFPDPDDPGELTEIVADDHLSLRAAPDGRLFLVAKDDIGRGRLHLYIRSHAGTWGQKTIVNRDPEAEPTRQTLVLDTENQHAYVIYRNSSEADDPLELNDDRIWLSRTSMSSPAPAFEEPCVLIESPSGSGRLNNVTSTKQNVNGTTDLVAAATREGQIFSSMLDLTSTLE